MVMDFKIFIKGYLVKQYKKYYIENPKNSMPIKT